MNLRGCLASVAFWRWVWWLLLAKSIAFRWEFCESSPSQLLWMDEAGIGFVALDNRC